jgi:hypothetical protein
MSAVVYRAVVKYELSADRDTKVRALRRGLTDCAVELVLELGLELSELEQYLDDAYAAAEVERPE